MFVERLYYSPPVARHIAEWQKKSLAQHIRQVQDVKLIYVASRPSDVEADTYASELSGVFTGSSIKVILGRPFEGGTVARGIKVPAVPADLWIHYSGLTLFVTQHGTTQYKPDNAVKVIQGFENACLKVSWATDFRLEENEYTLFVGLNQGDSLDFYSNWSCWFYDIRRRFKNILFNAN
jgi:hypothetical protein